MATDPNADIDLYAGVDELDPEIHQVCFAYLFVCFDSLIYKQNLHI